MVVLDVFIGLVLVYFLYSLLVSLMGEILSTSIGMRARILRQGIDNFLNDKHPKKHGIFVWLHDLFLVEHTDFRYSNAGKFYDEPTIKYLAKVGENKRWSMVYTKPAYIEKSHFVTAIINMFLSRSIGVNEWDKVKFAVENNTLNLEPETLKMFQNWLAQSEDSYPKFKAFIGNSFEEVNDRLVGWYKRKIGVFLFVMGALLSLIMNVDTFEIVQTLTNDPDKRQQVLEMAIATSKTKGTFILADSLKRDSIYRQHVDSAFTKSLSSIDEISTLLGSGWSDIPEKGLVKKTAFLVKQANPFSQKFWGFIITAFAISLGAKFWFDILKKLIALRGSGDKPDEHHINKTKTDPEAPTSSNGLKLNTDDPAIIALSNNRKKWETQPGFIAANVRYEDNNEGYIELIFEDKRDTDKMPSSVPNPLHPMEHVRLKYLKGKKGSFDTVDTSDILNCALYQSNTRSWGTPAGVVYDPRTKKNMILTCGHVVRNNKTAFIDETKSKIQYKNPETGNLDDLGFAKNIVLSSFCDAGIVEVNESFNNKIKDLKLLNKVRDVSSVEEHNTIVKIHTLRKDAQSSNGKLTVKGKIIYTGQNWSFQDLPSPDFRFYDLFMIGDQDGDLTKKLTESGDSGSLITDENDNQIGILVGGVTMGDQHYSYGIKLKDIFEILQLQPAKNEKKYNYFVELPDSATSNA